jgi:RNA polymerase sigma-70 factor (ECF subfamily)
LPNDQGRHTDFKSVVERYQEKVRNTCFRFVNSSEDADDLAQEVFIQVYESLPHFREESELSTWIYRIAVNKSLDFIRKKNRKKRFARLTSLFGPGEGDEEIVASGQDNPHQELESKELREILWRAVDSLPENQKTAIVLSKYEGFGNKEVASIMELSLSSAEALIHRAKKALHRELQRYYQELR